jgi:predicted transcriptional regulator
MNNPPPLGEHELAALRFITDNAPISVGDVAKVYGLPRGLARTTILTMMERLRLKGYLTRRQVDGVFRYAPRILQKDLLLSVVDEFVQRSLGGSLSPFVTYLADRSSLTDEEIQQLHRIVENLEREEEVRP